MEEHVGTSRIAPSMRLGDRFELIERLGDGAAGRVWVARHVRLHIRVAIKFLEERTLSEPEALRRLEREAKTAASIRSSHVVQVFDYCRGGHTPPYVVLELLRGESLRARVQRDGPMELQQVLQLVTEACKGLKRAHEAGIVHGSINPRTLFLSEGPDGFVTKLTDFGAVGADPLGRGLGASGPMAEGLSYMSPEQVAGRQVDHCADLYSLAATAYFALLGFGPFSGLTGNEFVHAVASVSPRDIRQARPDLGPEIANWFRRALRKDRHRRFPTARRMAEAFASAVQDNASPFLEWTAPDLDIQALLEAERRLRDSTRPSAAPEWCRAAFPSDDMDALMLGDARVSTPAPEPWAGAHAVSSRGSHQRRPARTSQHAPGVQSRVEAASDVNTMRRQEGVADRMPGTEVQGSAPASASVVAPLSQAARRVVASRPVRLSAVAAVLLGAAAAGFLAARSAPDASSVEHEAAQLSSADMVSALHSGARP